MKRRKFLKNSAVAAGLVSIPGTFIPLTSCKRASRRSSGIYGTVTNDIRSTSYLQKLKSEKILPKPSILLGAFNTSSAVNVSPMPLAERIRQKIVPQRGFCSLAPGGYALISGNGAVSIELTGNPYTERIPFNHESLFAPRNKSLETSKIANVFPKVRQMMLDGKYHEAILLDNKEWQ